MESNSLLGHLAYRYVTQRENLATEALCYILSRSEAARCAFVDALSVRSTSPLVFRTQASGVDGAIPDLVGRDADGMDRLVVEAKFWAGLTPAQPVTYLKRLTSSAGGDLVFLVPGRRMALVRDELVSRCRQEGIDLGEFQQTSEELTVASVSKNVRLMLTSWRHVLSAILQAASRNNQDEIASDIRQLHGLAAREDSEAFLPLSSEELTTAIGHRIIQFGEMIDELVARLVNAQLADRKRFRTSSGNGWYGRYFIMSGAGCYLHFSAWKWGSIASTPLWLRVTGPAWVPIPALSAPLEQLRRRWPLPFCEGTDLPLGVDIPIQMQLGVERTQLMDGLFSQLQLIAAEVAKAHIPPQASSSEPIESA